MQLINTLGVRKTKKNLVELFQGRTRYKISRHSEQVFPLCVLPLACTSTIF